MRCQTIGSIVRSWVLIRSDPILYKYGLEVMSEKHLALWLYSGFLGWRLSPFKFIAAFQLTYFCLWGCRFLTADYCYWQATQTSCSLCFWSFLVGIVFGVHRPKLTAGRRFHRRVPELSSLSRTPALGAFHFLFPACHLKEKKKLVRDQNEYSNFPSDHWS